MHAHVLFNLLLKSFPQCSCPCERVQEELAAAANAAERALPEQVCAKSKEYDDVMIIYFFRVLQHRSPQA